MCGDIKSVKNQPGAIKHVGFLQWKSEKTENDDILAQIRQMAGGKMMETQGWLYAI